MVIMCQPLEDFLVSRVGFRLCLTFIFTILVTAIGLNVQYLLARHHKELLEGQQLPGDDQAASQQAAVTASVVTTPVVEMSQAQQKKTNILYWTDHNHDDIGFLQLSRRITYLRDFCPQLNDCSFTAEKSKLFKSDAVVVSAKKHFPFSRMRRRKNASSRPILGLLISDPSYHRAFVSNNNIGLVGSDESRNELGLVISYLPNSTFPLIQARFRPKKDHKVDRSNKLDTPSYMKTGLRGKSEKNNRLVATILEDCSTEGHREQYIQQLQKHVSVHIYGKCGAPCPGKVTEECLQYLDKHYKFFLVFEPYICQHYMSADLWRLLAQSESMIPVVFGGVNYADILPPSVGYIDALNQTPELLAHTLVYLSLNQTAVGKYLQWRTGLQLELTDWPCQLCKTIRNSDSFNSNGINGNLMQNLTFSGNDGLCTSWPRLDFAQNHG